MFGGGRGGRVWGVESQGIRRGTKNKIEVKLSEGEREERTKWQLEKEKQELVEWDQKPQYLLLSLIYTLAWLGYTFCYTKWRFQAILEVVIWAKQDILSAHHVMESLYSEVGLLHAFRWFSLCPLLPGIGRNSGINLHTASQKPLKPPKTVFGFSEEGIMLNAKTQHLSKEREVCLLDFNNLLWNRKHKKCLLGVR